MIRVETMGLAHYEIAGVNETAAAAEFEKGYDLLLHTYKGDFSAAVNDLEDSVKAKYGVEVKLTV